MAPIDGHPPGLDRPHRLRPCPPCRAGDHASCRYVLGCECPGWADLKPFPTLLPCLDPLLKEHP